MATNPNLPTPPIVQPVQLIQLTQNDLKDPNLGILNQFLQTLTNSHNASIGAGGPSVLPAGINVAGGTVTGLGAPTSPSDAISLAHADSQYSPAAQKSQLDIGGSQTLNSLPLLWMKINKLSQPGVFQQNNVTGSRAFATVYQNTGAAPLRVYVTISAPGGTAGTALAVSDANPAPSSPVGQASAQTSGGSPVESMLVFEVLPGNYYEVTRDTSIVILYWIECSG